MGVSPDLAETTDTQSKPGGGTLLILVLPYDTCEFLRRTMQVLSDVLLCLIYTCLTPKYMRGGMD